MKPILLKTWLMEHAIRIGITYHGAYERYRRGELGKPKLRRENARVIWVVK